MNYKHPIALGIMSTIISHLYISHYVDVESNIYLKKRELSLLIGIIIWYGANNYNKPFVQNQSAGDVCLLMSERLIQDLANF